MTEYPGEFELIKRMLALLPQKGEGLVKGSGDDCAVFDLPEGFSVVATCDSLVEGVHFLSDSDPFLVGRKAVAVNISDVAAMGAIPAFLLVSLALPEKTPVAFMESLSRGMAFEAQRYGAAIIGGNMAKSPQGVIIDITCLGRIEKGKALYRRGAREGDLVAVTGTLGDSAAGLLLLKNPDFKIDENIRLRLAAAHATPAPRVEEGRFLSASGMVSSSIDVSDGLVADLGHILEQSGRGADIFIDRLPISHELVQAAQALGKDPVNLALYGGEDYELCFTLPETEFQLLREKFSGSSLAPISAIGRITGQRDEIRLIDSHGIIKAAENDRGWDHFRRKDS
ncbi:MAG: thiamine-phosphate kinase [Deltaproteobacteria bacterium]|nr:thiamine-phosphate kinase [Deltaproteobacteria bacterium]